MKTIAFITRIHPQRANMLKKCIKSVKMQTSNDYIHILYKDDKTSEGYGIASANRSLVKIKNINAKYIMILDDDDMLIDPRFVSVFRKNIDEKNPEIIFFKGSLSDGRGIYPKPQIWGKAPKFTLIASFCFAVRLDIWMSNIHEFGKSASGNAGGDFSFISRCYKKTKNHLWLDRVIAKTQGGAGRGKGEREHV